MKPTSAHSTSTIKAKVTREEQAALELGHTEFTKGTREALVIFFLVVITSVPLIQIYSAFHTPERVTRFIAGLRGLAPSGDRIKAVDGVISAVNLLPTTEQIKGVEDDWEQNSIVGETLLPRVQSLLLTVGHGNEKVQLGNDGWLFYRSDVDYVTGKGFLDPHVMKRRAGSATAVQPDPIKAIINFRDQLAARGIQLIIVPAAAKPSIYPEHYSRGGSGTPLQNPSFEEFKTRLSEASVTVFDPAPILAVEKSRAPALPLYLKTDTHWSPHAVENIASQLADFARSTVTLPPAIKRFTSVEKTIENIGDTALMLKLPREQIVFPPEAVRVRQVLDGENPWRPIASSEVLFIGDSFANIYSLGAMGWGESAGFVEHLSFALGLPLDAICRNDAGSHATREMLANELRKGNDRLAGKKLVIWEFAARELASGNWKIISIAPGEKKTSGFFTPTSGAAIEVRGTVRAISPAPHPGSVPYKDHILMIHLSDLTSENEPMPAGKDAVVFAWSMRDNIAMPAARLHKGSAVSFRLRPWSDVAANYDKINRSELNSEELLLADACWAVDVNDEHVATKPIKVRDTGSESTNLTLPAGQSQQASPPTALNENDFPASFRQLCAAKAAAGDSMSVAGKDGWLFLRSELRHIGVGQFWGPAAGKVSKATSPDKADPLPAIVDFNQQLKALGIELIVAPVPCKALVYPENVENTPSQRLDSKHQEFLKLLSAKGVKILDLANLFAKEKEKQNTPFLYCKSDSHWSPYACELAAKSIKDIIGKREWLNATPHTFNTKREIRTIAGDQSDGKSSEELAARVVERSEGAIEDKASPVVLLGDSHLLVFHAGGDMHGTGAGLPDQLALELGIPVDVIAVRGSGATPSRVNLMRRARSDPSYLAGKKVVVWCFTAREFTESTGWSIFKLKN